MHVIDEATGDPPTLSTRRRAVVVFLKSLDLAMNLCAYQDRGRVESGQRGTYFAGQCTDRLSSPGLKEHGKIQVPEPLSSGAELPANEVKNSRVRGAEFQSLTMSKSSPTLLLSYSIRSLCEENGRLARATGAAGEACPFKSFAIARLGTAVSTIWKRSGGRRRRVAQSEASCSPFRYLLKLSQASRESYLHNSLRHLVLTLLQLRVLFGQQYRRFSYYDGGRP
ncbi:hypothetical protein CTAM01_03599 [Colletotrichum tamarilloi]|uniref:Uncharacterized protein n=1 Tax=Colletotrichum tamarilloi TaxID=1209934 RepID=A0ABQ9RKU3_9PEZI|nr:uncharacterized protein CTAM01_03599 [Colletotrichum tamarilloi]KAK1506264.1 hypothetical protein CTAM01_03599 [Colletotrichum tamarilloi]